MNKYSVMIQMHDGLNCLMEIYDDTEEKLIDTTLDSKMEFWSAMKEAEIVIEKHFLKENQL